LALETTNDLFWRMRWYGLAVWLAYRDLTIPCLLELSTAEAAAISLRVLLTLTASVPVQAGYFSVAIE